MMRKSTAVIYDLNEWNYLPKRIRETVKKLKYITKVGRYDPNEPMCSRMRKETAFAKRLRAFERERREKLD
jgi:hypothetical protein